MKFEHYYEEAGSGYPLILLHGNSESAEYFRHQIDYFSEEYRVIAVDTRGHGRSPRGDGPFSISRFADDLNDFMERHGIEKAHILGFSDGGNTALVFALRYPQRVNRLILNGANLYFSGMYAAVCLPILLRYVFWSLFKSVSAKADVYKRQSHRHSCADACFSSAAVEVRRRQIKIYLSPRCLWEKIS